VSLILDHERARIRHHTVPTGTVSEGGSVPPSLRAAGFEDDDEDEDEDEAPCFGLVLSIYET
jgi:hypothetical protein